MVFSDAGPPVSVKWFRAADDAELFPSEHCFFSYNWDTDSDLSPLGEQQRQPLPWNNGQGPSCAKGQGPFLGDPSWFANGQPSSGPSPVPWNVNSGGFPQNCCCTPAASGAYRSSSLSMVENYASTCGGLLFSSGIQVKCQWKHTFILFTFPIWATFPNLIVVNAEMQTDKLGASWYLSEQQLGNFYVVQVVPSASGCGSWQVRITLEGVGTWGPTPFPVFPTFPTIFSTDGVVPFTGGGPHEGETIGVNWNGRSF